MFSGRDVDVMCTAVMAMLLLLMTAMMTMMTASQSNGTIINLYTSDLLVT